MAGCAQTDLATLDKPNSTPPGDQLALREESKVLRGSPDPRYRHLKQCFLFGPAICRDVVGLPMRAAGWPAAHYMKAVRAKAEKSAREEAAKKGQHLGEEEIKTGSAAGMAFRHAGCLSLIWYVCAPLRYGRAWYFLGIKEIVQFIPYVKEAMVVAVVVSAVVTYPWWGQLPLCIDSVVTRAGTTSGAKSAFDMTSTWWPNLRTVFPPQGAAGHQQGRQ